MTEIRREETETPRHWVGGGSESEQKLGQQKVCCISIWKTSPLEEGSPFCLSVCWSAGSRLGREAGRSLPAAPLHQTFICPLWHPRNPDSPLHTPTSKPPPQSPGNLSIIQHKTHLPFILYSSVSGGAVRIINADYHVGARDLCIIKHQLLMMNYFGAVQQNK